jgi:8-oxo-dGTP diphosphatase
MRSRTAVFGVIESPEGLLLVANRRGRGRLDWTPPGGLVDRGESSLEALTREVREESGLMAADWSTLLYTAEVQFRETDRPKNMYIEVWRAGTWGGELSFYDHDGVVEHGVFADNYLALYLMRRAAKWIRQPLGQWLINPWPDDEPQEFSYRVTGNWPDQKSERWNNNH